MNREAIELMLANLKRIRDREDQRQRFDLSIWNNGKDLDVHGLAIDDETCSFAGCVLGWAGHERWFEPMGLRIELLSGPEKGDITLIERDDKGEWNYTDGSTDEVVGRFLDVDRRVVSNIIYPEEYPNEDDVTIEQVIERVEVLLEKGENAFMAWCREQNDCEPRTD